MIHVQIASELTADGVRGVRWVLLEAAEPSPEAAAPADPATGNGTGPAAPAPTSTPVVEPPATAGTESVADSLRLRVLKALVVALGLGAALWTAAVQIGPPGRVVPAAPGPASAATLPAPGAAPHPMPTLPPAALAPAPASPARPAAPQSTADAPASAPAAAPGLPATQPSAPASAGLPRLTASL